MREGFRKSINFIPGERAGESIEQELLGVVKEGREIESERAIIKEIMEQKRVSELRAAIFDIKERQTQNPVNPGRPFANFVRFKTTDMLGAEDSLRYYTAISPDVNKKTMLDRDFGIDAFFELEREGKESVFVTIDLTLKPLKKNPKAAIVFRVPENFPIQAYFKEGKIEGLSESEWKVFNVVTDELAEEVADKFKKLSALNK